MRLHCPKSFFYSVKSHIDDTYIQEKSLEEYGVTNKREICENQLFQLRQAMKPAK